MLKTLFEAVKNVGRALSVVPSAIHYSGQAAIPLPPWTRSPRTRRASSTGPSTVDMALRGGGLRFERQIAPAATGRLPTAKTSPSRSHRACRAIPRRARLASDTAAGALRKCHSSGPGKLPPGESHGAARRRRGKDDRSSTNCRPAQSVHASAPSIQILVRRA